MLPISKLFAAGFDEASFALVTGLKQLQKKPQQFVTNRGNLEMLREMMQHGPEEFFVKPPNPQVQEEMVVRPWQISPYGQEYQVKHVTFPSAVSLGYENNDTVHGYFLYRPGYEQAPTLFYLHGWMAYSYGLWLRGPLSWAEALGLNVFFMEQPFHMRRCPPGSQSGEMSLSGDLMMGMAGVQQAVSDTRASLAWLKMQGVEQVGLLGRSMGGLVAASSLTVETEFDCAILDIPAVSPQNTIWRSSYTRLVREELRQQGFDEQETAAFFEVVRPGRFQPTIDPERILLIEATADRACFPDETERFAQEWKLPTVRINTGHMSIMLSRQARRSALEFLGRWLNT